MLNIGWFSTGRDKAAVQLLQAVQQSISNGDITGKISFVFSNREPGESQESDLFFELVRSYGIPLICLSHKKFKERLVRRAHPERDSSVAPLPQNDNKGRTQNDKVVCHPERNEGSQNDKVVCHPERNEGSQNDSPSFVTLNEVKSLQPGTGNANNVASGETKQAQEDWRLRYDREVYSRIRTFAPDLCILAGYMLIVGEELCRKYTMINLHPAPPGGPVGSWQEVIWKLIQDKADKAGAMMHLVTPELDRGPAIGYCLFPIKGKPFDQYWQSSDRNMLFNLIRQHELATEFPLIISTLKALSQGEISIKNGKVIDAQGRSIDGYDLTEEINRAVSPKRKSKGKSKNAK